MKRISSLGPQIAVTVMLIACAAPPAQPQTPDDSPSRPVVLTPELRGDLAMARQQYVDALKDYREVTPASALIWNKIGLAYHHLLAVDLAKRAYQQALRLEPNYPEALNNMGAIFYAHRSYHKAEKYYLKALKLDPNQASILSNLGTAYFADRKAQLGIDAYRKAFALDPTVFSDNSLQLVSASLPAHDRAQQDYCIAILFAQTGRVPQAIEYLRKALNEGFDDRDKLMHDRTLASLRTTPEFSELMAEQKLR
jgi:tetratricopeptide (TPR) repeat protein